MNEIYYFYYIVPNTKYEKIEYSYDLESFDDDENRKYERDEDDRLWTLYQVIESVGFNAFKTTVSSNKFTSNFITHEFDEYINKYLTFKNQDIKCLNIILFVDYNIFSKSKLNVLNICDKLEYSNLYGLKSYRDIHQLKDSKYDCVLIESDMYRKPSKFYYYKKPYNFYSTKNIDEFNPSYKYNVIFCDLNLVKFIANTDKVTDDLYENNLTIKLNILLQLFTRLSKFLNKGGYLIINTRHTFSFIIIDILKYLSTLFSKVSVSKPLSYKINSFYVCIICENYLVKDNLPPFDKIVYRLYAANPPLADFWKMYDQSLYDLRTSYIEKLEVVLSKPEKGDDIRMLQNDIVNRYIYIYNLLEFPIPIYLLFDGPAYMSSNKLFLYNNLKMRQINFIIESGNELMIPNLESLNNIKLNLFYYKLHVDLLDPIKYQIILSKIDCYDKYMISSIINIKISQAFITIMEMIKETNLIDSNISSLHLCEAPGEFIVAFDYYCKKKGLTYNWVANTLNQKNPEIIKKHGRNIVYDAYDLIKDNPNKWLYGKDNTGDLTRIENILELSKSKYNMITSNYDLLEDSGFQEDESLFMNLCQIMIILLSLKVGGNACLKTFLPCSLPLTVSLIYILTKSFDQVILFKSSINAVNCEISIICKKFQGLKYRNLLFDAYNNFDPNKFLFEKIDELFINNLTFAIEEITKSIKSHLFRSILIYYYLTDFSNLKNETKEFTQNWINKYLK